VKTFGKGNGGKPETRRTAGPMPQGPPNRKTPASRPPNAHVDRPARPRNLKTQSRFVARVRSNGSLGFGFGAHNRAVRTLQGFVARVRWNGLLGLSFASLLGKFFQHTRVFVKYLPITVSQLKTFKSGFVLVWTACAAIVLSA